MPLKKWSVTKMPVYPAALCARAISAPVEGEQALPSMVCICVSYR